MGSIPDNSQPIVPRYDEELLRDLFFGAPRNHDDYWRNIQPEEAAYIRKAMVHAQKLRDMHFDPGDAYLHGIAMTLEAERRARSDITSLLVIALPAY